MAQPARKILVVDIGGSHVKLMVTGQRTPIKVVSGPTLTPRKLMTSIRPVIAEWKYDAVAIGYPAPVRGEIPFAEPFNLGSGWVGFDFGKAFRAPVRFINDAAMQALGGYQGGRMLFLGLGTGLGSALVLDGQVQPLELAHLPYRKDKTFEEYVGDAALRERGKKKWRESVTDVVSRLQFAMQADYVLLGGGNARHLTRHRALLPKGTILGGNADAMRGGARLWQSAQERTGNASSR
jgi:polyphosphate glucokinase